MKFSFSLFDLPDYGFVVLFFHMQLVMWKKNEKKIPRIRQTRKCQLSRRNGKRQSANAKNGGKIMVTWSLLPFAFPVNVMLNLSNKRVQQPRSQGPLSRKEERGPWERG